MADDETAERFAAVAAQAAQRLREGPQQFHHWLYDAMRVLAAARGRPADKPFVSDWLGMCSMLAAAIPADSPEDWEALTEWLRRPDLKPHGTMAALRRHQAAKERPCALCRAWEAGFKTGRHHRDRADGQEAA